MEVKTTVAIDEEVWKKFLAKAIEKYGPEIAEAKKKALEEALRLWLSQ
jgi:hypothetical protein